ncbi:MAG: hypothetical protein JKY49_03040 [Cohaesibacteraceae bacterium]|nr:hypothetical protein [Cohaesibacteraceae bacterium]MBL4875238.1 hypothetical protein [Cohaesibacteraceae bacterium]
MKYSILIYGAESIIDRLPAGKIEELFVGHRELQKQLAIKGQFVSVKLMRTSSAVTLKPAQGDSEKPIIVDGPYAETKENFLGFYVADFDSLEHAIEYASLISSPYVTLEIRPIDWNGGILGSPQIDLPE